MARTGRPSKLTPEIIELAWEYVEETENMGTHVLLPTIERLANRVGVHRDTLDVWGKENDDFSDILNTLRQNQADKLLQNSLVGKYNPVITKLMLSKHGYVDKQETDVTSKGEAIQGALDTASAAAYAEFLKSKQ